MAIIKKTVRMKSFVCFEEKRDGQTHHYLKRKYVLGGTCRYSSAAVLHLRRRKERGKGTKTGGKEKKTITKRRLNEINTKMTESGRKTRASSNITWKRNIILTHFLLDYPCSVSFYLFCEKKSRTFLVLESMSSQLNIPTSILHDVDFSFSPRSSWELSEDRRKQYKSLY